MIGLVYGAAVLGGIVVLGTAAIAVLAWLGKVNIRIITRPPDDPDDFG